MSAGLALWIALALLVLARGLLVFTPSMWAWGLNAQRFLDPIVGWSLWSLAALGLFAPSLPRLVTAAERAGDWIARGRRAPLVAALAGAALVWLLADRVWFIGDFVIRQGNVESGFFSGNFFGALPLDRLLHSTLLRPLGHGSAESANVAGRALGAVEAGILAMLGIGFARALRLRRTLALLAAVAVFFGGHLTVFTGLGKPSTEMCLAVAALAVFGIRAARDGSSLLATGLVMALALGIHRSSLLILPSWILVLVLWRRAAPSGAWTRRGNLLGVSLPVVVGLFAVPRILSIALGYDVSHHVLTAERASQGGLWRSMFSARHLLDLANLLVALSPLVIAIPILAFARRERVGDPAGPVLGLLALSFVPALLLVEPQQGIFRDWDVFAPAGLAFSLFAAFQMIRLPESSGRSWLAIAATGVALSGSLEWLALNHDAPRGLARVRTYLLEPPGPEAGDRPLVWDFLTQRSMRLGHWREAIDAAEHTAADAPHRRIFLMWALSATMAEDWPMADSVYRRLLEKEPDDPLGWLGLAGVARRTGDRATLERAIARLRSYPPDGPEMRVIRRHLLYYPQVWPWTEPVEGWTTAGSIAGHRVEVDTLSVKSGSLRLTALLYRPTGPGPFPGILFNHGGGHRTGVGLDGNPDQRHPQSLGQRFAQHGYVFLYPYRRGDGLSRDQGVAAGDAMDDAAAHGGQARRNAVQLERLTHEDMGDALAALSVLRARGEVDPRRVAIVGHSFGGSLALLMTAKDPTLRAAVVFSGAGASWNHSPELRRLLLAAIAHGRAPLLFLHAANDYSTAPGESLAARARQLGRSAVVRIHPSVGTTPEEGHDFVHRGAATWDREVFGFLDSLLAQ